MNTKRVIANNLKNARISKHMTQSEVAIGAKINTNHYAKIERGEAIPTITTLERILKSIGVKSSDILPF
jgi:transcriptional regulator with XRE-family HTH domain